MVHVYEIELLPLAWQRRRIVDIFSTRPNMKCETKLMNQYAFFLLSSYRSHSFSTKIFNNFFLISGDRYPAILGTTCWNI